MKKIILKLIICMIPVAVYAQEDLAKYVNPFIGTGGHGHTFPGPTLPHGMLQLSPDTRLEGWDGCSGYHYSDSFIYGFSHTHLSGTGVSDYGDILLMPMGGKPSADNSVYGSRFSHTNEKASAGYYSVLLEDDNIQAEFTTTERVGFHHYDFKNSPEHNFILDLKHRDEVIESSLQIEDSFTVSGLRRSRGWADNQYVFFVMKFSKPILNHGVWENGLLKEGISASESKDIKAYFNFNSAGSKDIYVKLAISPVSVEGARKNMGAEIPDWDFEGIKKMATEKWNEELSRIEVKSEDTDQLKIFYTALYHTSIVPNIYMDVDGRYRGRDNQVHTAVGFTYYSVFSLWDTYRAAHPLYTIIDRERSLDYIKTFLLQYQQGGALPVWELASCETECMIGYHSIPVITDAFIKGIDGFDTDLALKAMLHSASRHQRGIPAYVSKGLIETDDEAESVSKTLEYAFDDYNIARFADLKGDTTVYNKYIKRAQYYKNLLDMKTGFIRPKKNGDWLQPFNPREVNNHFTEANSWQYSFYFPQDMEGYMKMTGGKKKLEQKLDALFNASSKTTGREQSDITGLIGQYAHGNEPSHHIIYLYNYAGKSFKTQNLVRKVMDEMYKNAPDGLIGNEDCGQMSAWYVFSALGFYPVTPGNGKYLIGTPLFPLAQINLENGKAFVINAPDNSDKNKYIQSALLSTSASLMPKKWDYAYLTDFDIAHGGLVTFMMGDKPANCFPKNTNGLGEIYPDAIVVNPVIHGGGISFNEKKTVAISSAQKEVNIYYTLDGTDPGHTSKKYSKPIFIDNSLVLKAIAINRNGKKSFITKAEYKKIKHGHRIRLNTKYEPQYDGGGSNALIDGIHGTTDWRKGNWQGYQKTGMDVIIDLGVIKTVRKIRMGFLQDTRSWIILPREVKVEASTDGKIFSEVYSGGSFLPVEDLSVQVKLIETYITAFKARYVRIKAFQYGKMPAWSEGAGGDTHIFADEIIIE